MRPRLQPQQLLCMLVTLPLLWLNVSSSDGNQHRDRREASDRLTLTVNSMTSLQQAIDIASSLENTAAYTKIQIPPGDHLLTAPTLFRGEINEIEMTGAGGGEVRLVCNYSVGSYNNYTWYFAGLQSVMLTGIGFEDCARPLRLDTVAEVSIQDCSFRMFAEAALDIFNCHHILFNHSLLQDNSGTGIVNASYRGNTGGVSFGYNTLPVNFSSPSLLVTDCVFRNNSARATSAFRTSSQAFFAQIFTGRGGSLALFVNESRYDLDVTIRNCTFTGNTARSFGGGVYLLLGGFGTSHRVVVKRARVISNVAQLGGGGFQASFFNNGPEDAPLMMRFDDCLFENNSGIAGGGVFVFTSTDGGVGNLVQIRSTVFIGNRGYTGGPGDYGAAVALSLLNPLVERSNFPRHEITDCEFYNNSGANGIVSVGYSPTNFTGRNVFSENKGTSLRVVGAIIYLSGELHFTNNIATSGDESAFHMLSFGQAILSRGLFVNFEGNSGRFGTSITIEATTTSTVYTRLAGNPQCPFLHEDFGTVPQNWTNVTVRFTDNSATLGSAIYVSRLNTCSWFSRKPPFFNNTFLVDWPIWIIEPSNVDTGYTEEEQRNATVSVQTQVNTLIISNYTVRAWPGQRLVIGVSGRDEFNHTTTATAGFSFTPLNLSRVVPEIRFVPEVIVVGPDPTSGLLTTTFTLYFGMGDSSLQQGTLPPEGTVGVVRVNDPIQTLPVSTYNTFNSPLTAPYF
jgi:hypothetical protein